MLAPRFKDSALIRPVPKMRNGQTLGGKQKVPAQGEAQPTKKLTGADKPASGSTVEDVSFIKRYN